MRTKSREERLASKIKTFDDIYLDELISKTIDKKTKLEAVIIDLLQEKQRRIINEIYIEKNPSKKKGLPLKETKRYKRKQEEARHTFNARALQRDLERKKKRMLRDRTMAGQ